MVQGFEKHHRMRDAAEAQAQAGDFRAARETADAIELEDSRDSALAAIAAAQAEAGDFKAADDTLGAMSTDLRRDEALYALARAHAKAGRLDEATKKAEAVSTEFGRIRAWYVMVQEHVRAKNATAAAECLKRARAIFDGLPEDDPKVETKAVCASLIAEALATTGDADAARKLADTVANEKWRPIAQSRVGVGQVLAKDLKGALATAETITGYDKGDLLMEIVKAQLAAGDVAAALKTHERIDLAFWSVEALAAIGLRQAKNGDAAAATKTFQKAIAAATDAQDVENRAGNLYNACLAHTLRAMAEAGQGPEALAWLSRHGDTHLRAQALVSIVEGLAARKAK
jgi:tetratricopeptide (TPR) repeat protein